MYRYTCLCLSVWTYVCMFVCVSTRKYVQKQNWKQLQETICERRTNAPKKKRQKQLEYYQNASRLCRLEACQPGCQAASHNNIDIQTDRHTNIHCRQMDGRTDGTDRPKQTSQYPTKQKKKQASNLKPMQNKANYFGTGRKQQQIEYFFLLCAGTGTGTHYKCATWR